MRKEWNKNKFDPTGYLYEIGNILKLIEKSEKWNADILRKALKQFPKDGKELFSKDQLLAGYKELIAQGKTVEKAILNTRLKMKPMRTHSGVATVTVLTKPYPCPGKCIFCPNDVKMPKSYLSDEPGAQRAERNNFDPYLQTYNRLLALETIGHKVSKVELIILGGTWSFYPTQYQIWFVKECFRAMNDFGNKDGRDTVETQNIFEEADKIPAHSKEGKLKTYNDLVTHVVNEQGSEFFSPNELSDWEELYQQHKINEVAKTRCVGLVIETRPDYIDPDEVIKIRKLGATKVQIGIQSLNDKVQAMNMRGHGRREAGQACSLLRQAGFKVHAHWMPNLYGSNPELDIADYDQLWEEDVRPDELKIYPCSIIKNTRLFELYNEGKYKPYTYDELLKVLTEVMPHTPRYCRLTRVVRDIPSTDIVAGNKLTNFRQIAESELDKNGVRCECIRCREIKLQTITHQDIEVEEIEYSTKTSQEVFISFKTKTDDKICGFLRLSLPNEKSFIEELSDNAIIREVHVYGKLVGIDKENTSNSSQHLGLGKQMIARSQQIASSKGYSKISVISAIGTREYYEKLGFEMNSDQLYMHKDA